jgi:hypothetical protein
MTQIQRPAAKAARTHDDDSVDLRTPSGRVLPF